MQLVKAEILITRHCNLSCEYCGMKADRPMIAPEWWIKAFEHLTEHFGVRFYPIYGAEPLLYPGIYDVLRYFRDNGGKSTYSLLTNATRLGPSTKDRLLEAGLQSITLSLDSVLENVGDESVAKRNSYAMKAIDWAMQNGVPDIQATAVVHRGNIDQVPQMVRMLGKNIWFSFDFIHGDKGEPEFSKVRESPLLFQIKDIDRIVTFLANMIALKSDGYKIYQSYEWLGTCMADVFHMVVRESWKCSAINPTWITVDSDGTVLPCDDLLKPSGIPAWELKDRWQEFMEYRKPAIRSCRGCNWSTHWMAENQQVWSSGSIEQLSHGRLTSCVESS